MTTPAPSTRPLTLPPTPSRREQDFSRPITGGPPTPSRREQDSSRPITGGPLTLSRREQYLSRPRALAPAGTRSQAEEGTR